MNPMVSMYDLDPFLLNTFCLLSLFCVFAFMFGLVDEKIERKEMERICESRIFVVMISKR